MPDCSSTIDIVTSRHMYVDDSYNYILYLRNYLTKLHKRDLETDLSNLKSSQDSKVYALI